VPKVSVFMNGAVVGFGPSSGLLIGGGRRSVVAGWSAGSARRLLHALFEVDAERLPDAGVSVTLTLDRDVSAEVFIELRSRLVDWLRQRADLVTWVVEWTARGRPHLHLAVYGDRVVEHTVVLYWLGLCSEFGLSPEWKAQHAEPIYGALGWLAYLAKHASRGVGHYQRQGVPLGWERTGRLWGFTGPWPRVERLTADVSPLLARAFRDALDLYVSEKRSQLAIAAPEPSVRYADEYRGVSVWIPLSDARVIFEKVAAAIPPESR